MATDLRAIGLLGGTFDPVHNGHIAIIKSYLNSGYIDILYVVLTPDPPHKNQSELTDFEHRKNMLELALNDMENVRISTIEQDLPKPSYTRNTVNYFAKQFPSAKLYLCIGEDSFKNFKSWYSWQEIVSQCTLLVAKRPETEYGEIPDELKEHTRFIDHQMIDISSTEIRNDALFDNTTNDKLPPEVLRYISEHHLYQN